MAEADDYDPRVYRVHTRPPTTYMVLYFLLIFQVGVCCVYYIFVSKSMKRVCDFYMGVMSIYMYKTILLIPFLLINSLPNLKIFAGFSLVANILEYVAFGIAIYYMVQGLPNLSERPLTAPIEKFPLFFGIAIFALEAVGVVMSVERNMIHPECFGGVFGVFSQAMIVITVSYIGIGFLGFWAFGDEAKGSLTLNLPQNEALANSVVLMYGIAIFISFGLQGYPFMEIFWEAFLEERLKDSQHKMVWEYGIRYCFVVASFILAIGIPRLGLFLSLVGSFCLGALGIAFPAIIEICALWPDDLGCHKWVMYKDIFYILLGLVGLTCGSYSSIYEIVISFQKDTNSTKT